MIVKCVNNENYPELEIGKEYETHRVVIGGFHTEVFLEGVEWPASSVCFDDNFQNELTEAIEYFNKNYKDYNNCYYGIFERDF